MNSTVRLCDLPPTRPPFKAFQALVLCSDLKQGDDVLIHAGASGVGTAAIQLSRLYGAYVFIQLSNST